MARVYRADGSRDYRAEYRQRIERVTAQGFSRSVARGHAKTKVKHTDDGQPYRVKVERPLRVERIRARVEADRRKAFGGDLPKRQRGESPAAFEARMDAARDAAARTRFDWDDMESFLDMARDEGLTEHEGHEIWNGY